MRIPHVIFVAAAFSTPAIAFPQHVDNIPNGNLAPAGSSANCQHCHTNRAGGEGWNLLGQYFLEEGGANPGANPNNQNLGYGIPTGPVWDAAACAEDADGDGFTNGEELGDPNCIWSPGDTPEITSGISNGGDPESTPTGGGEGEGEGEGEDVLGGCAATAPAPLVALLALVKRRRR